MTAEIVEIRAREMTALRKQNRALRAELESLRDRAGENDATLMVLHNLALLLAEKAGAKRHPRVWVTDAEALLARGLCGRGGFCRAAYFSPGRDSALRRTATKLRADGYAGESPPPEMESMEGMRSYCAAPLRRGRETIGILLLAARGEAVFPPDASRDFLRRLAQLMAAAAP